MSGKHIVAHNSKIVAFDQTAVLGNIETFRLMVEQICAEMMNEFGQAAHEYHGRWKIRLTAELTPFKTQWKHDSDLNPPRGE